MNIFFVRHAEGIHNIIQENNQNLNIKQPPLSQKGRDQAKQLNKELLKLDIDIVLISPTTRTLQTSIIACNNIDVELIAYPAIREVLHNPCDYRKFKSILQNNFISVDFSLILHNDPLKLYEEDDLIYKRCDDFYEYLQNLNYKNVVVISHNGFIYRFLKKYGDKLNIVDKSRLKNCEIRKGFLI